MPRTIRTTVYGLDELTDRAKETARDWFREVGFEHDWFAFVYDDFERVCAILGVTLETRAVRLVGGDERRKPCIWFSGFWSQGDGTCFEGAYRYAKGASAQIRKYAPEDVELHDIADALQTVQKRNLFQLRAAIDHRGRYYHEYTMAISVERDSPTGQDSTPDAEDAVIEAMRDLARWLYRRLEDEYEHLTCDAAIDEAIRANAYTFTEDGRRFG